MLIAVRVIVEISLQTRELINAVFAVNELMEALFACRVLVVIEGALIELMLIFPKNADPAVRVAVDISTQTRLLMSPWSAIIVDVLTTPVPVYPDEAIILLLFILTVEIAGSSAQSLRDEMFSVVAIGIPLRRSSALPVPLAVVR